MLSPGLGGVGAGGIQESARIAWGGFRRQGQRDNKRLALLSYGPVHDIGADGSREHIVAAGSRSGLLVRSALRRWDADVVLVWHLGLMKLLPFLRGRWQRIFVFLHGIEAWRPLPRRVQRLLNRVDCFLSNSEFTWQRFVEFNPVFNGKPHQTVHLGSGEPVGAVPRPEDFPAALMIGRMSRSEDYKGHRELIAAWPRVLVSVPDARLWIAGDGDLRPVLEDTAARLGIGDNVHFWGRVSEATKDDLLRRCRCLAMPSRSEGFGLVYLEAMRVGRPCLVSTCDAGREVVEPPVAGLAVDPKDQTALVQAVETLLSSGDAWQKQSLAARQRYESNYTAVRFQERLLAALSPN